MKNTETSVISIAGFVPGEKEKEFSCSNGKFECDF